MSDRDTDVTGVVLAGGRSRRFGDRDKALATLSGDPLLVHVVRTLVETAGRAVVNCRTDQRAAYVAALRDAGLDESVVFAVDDRPDEGPLAGIVRALDAVETTDAVVLACDMPLVTAEHLRELCGLARDQQATVVPRTHGGMEPTCAVYRVDRTATVAREVYDAGERSLHALLDALSPSFVDATTVGLDATALTSVDTEAGLAAIRTETEGNH